MRKLLVLAALAAVLFAGTAVPVEAKRGKHSEPTAEAGCTVQGTVVSAYGLPTWELINFLITPEGGETYGWVLGQTDVGTWDVNVPERTSHTTYEFVSRTWGPNGSKYNVYASCSAGP